MLNNYPTSVVMTIMSPPGTLESILASLKHGEMVSIYRTLPTPSMMTWSLKLISNIFVRFHEDKGKEHWYPGVFDSIPVQQFLRQHLDAEGQHSVTSFTLTVSNPAHSGSLYGWTINELGIPGRCVVCRSGYGTE